MASPGIKIVVIIGIDLSGPSNTTDSSVVVFSEEFDQLQLVESVEGATDEDVFQLFCRLSKESHLKVGLDAPLSYNPGGGDRPADKALRKETIAHGMHPGSVMTPTTTRMVYLTLRGLAIARLLESLHYPRLAIVEVHPGAAMALGGADIGDVKSLKRQPEARQNLLRWLDSEGLQGIVGHTEPTDHFVASCACALAAWKWSKGLPSWLWKGDLPHHPYDFAC